MSIAPCRVGRACPVRAACLHPTHCPDCIDGSEFATRLVGIVHPAHEAAHAARRAVKQARKEAQHSPAAERGRRSAHKGRRVEHEAARFFGGRRVPLSGALDGLPNDVVLPAPGQPVPADLDARAEYQWLLAHGGWRAEVKGRRTGLEWLTTRLETVDWVAIHQQDGPWLYAVSGDRFRQGVDVEVADALRAEGLRPRLGPWEGPLGTRGRREVRQKIQTLWDWLHAETADVLLFKRDRAPWVVVMDEAHWVAWQAGSHGI